MAIEIIGDDSRQEVDALCPECGQGFKAYVDRIVPEEHQGHGKEQQRRNAPTAAARSARFRVRFEGVSSFLRRR